VTSFAASAHAANELIAARYWKGPGWEHRGFQFRTPLLEFHPEFLAGMNQKERLEMTERIPKQAAVLAGFLEANLKAFNTQPAVWMPMSVLP
jgi:hypothetical protein